MERLKAPATRPAKDQLDVAQRVADMLTRIRVDGESAVREFSAELDSWNPTSFRVDEDEIAGAQERISDGLRASIDFAIDQVRSFAELQRETLVDLDVTTDLGVRYGHRHLPVQSVGAYVPGGIYGLIASAYMTVVPAVVAGVEQVSLCTPPRDGKLDPALLYAARASGADAIYAIGGVQAIGAMAFGAIEGLAPVDMVVGPGNRFVVEAKRQVFGDVGIDLLAGPTEIGIVADDSADPFVVACDLVGQAEHDPYARSVLITTSRELGAAVLSQIDEHLRAVSTERVARASWENCGEILIAADDDELVDLANAYALEHVEVMVREPASLVDRLTNAGSLFIGEEATVAYGDKVSGPNHVLPTMRSARFTGGLWVGKYLRTTTFQEMTRPASVEMAAHCANVSRAEGMVAHARTADIRLERWGQARNLPTSEVAKQ